MKLIKIALSLRAWFAACETSVSACDDDESTLMQTRVRTNGRSVTLGVQHSDANSQLSLEKIERLVSGFATKDPTAEEVSLVTDLIATMENEFLPELATQSQADMTAYTAYIAAHNLCTADKTTRLGAGGDVTQLNENAAKTRAKHQACRRATKSYAVFRADLDAVHAGDWDTLAPASGDTQVPALSTLCPNKIGFQNDVVAYSTLDPVGVVSKTCDVDQGEFELTWCNWFSAKWLACYDLDRCISQLNAEASKLNILTRDVRRRATRHSILILQCRLRHIADTFNSVGSASNSTLVDECSNVDAPPADYFNLVFADPVTVVLCSSDADITEPAKPSASDASACAQWRSKEYNADGQQNPITWNSVLHSSVDACLGTCVVPTAACAPQSLKDIFLPSMVTWTADSEVSEFSVSGSVLTFKPCVNGNGITENHCVDNPVVTADILLPCHVQTISGSFEQAPAVAGHHPDDCSKTTDPFGDWNPEMAHYQNGYVMFGTPEQIIYGGCGHGQFTETKVTAADATQITPPAGSTSRLRFAVSQNNNLEHVAIDLSGVWLNRDPPACAPQSLKDIFLSKMVTWTADSEVSAFSVSGSVLTFTPCKSGSCADNPVVTADIVLPCRVQKISGKFEQAPGGEGHHPDDCYANAVPFGVWNPELTESYYGYVMFGTPEQIIYGGCSHGVSFSETKVTAVDATQITGSTSVLRFAVSQNHEDESVAIDLSGVLLNHDPSA